MDERFFAYIKGASERMWMYHRSQTEFYKWQDQRNITAAHVERLLNCPRWGKTFSAEFNDPKLEGNVHAAWTLIISYLIFSLFWPINGLCHPPSVLPLRLWTLPANCLWKANISPLGFIHSTNIYRAPSICPAVFWVYSQGQNKILFIWSVHAKEQNLIIKIFHSRNTKADCNYEAI